MKKLITLKILNLIKILKLNKEQEALDGYDIKRELNEKRSNRIKKKI